MAVKRTYVYLVQIGEPDKIEGYMYVRARNQARAIDFCKRVMRFKGRKYSYYRGRRSQAAAGAMVWSENSLPWNIDIDDLRDIAAQITPTKAQANE